MIAEHETDDVVLQVPSPVLILTNQLHTGGAERWVLAVARWLADQGAEVRIAATPGELVPEIDVRVPFHAIDLKDLRAGVPLAAWRVRRLIRRQRPAVILTNSLVTAWVAKLAAGLRGPRVVSVAHGWAADRYPIVAPPMNLADRVVPVSDDVARRLTDAGLRACKVRVVHNGIDTTPFQGLDDARRRSLRASVGAQEDDVLAVNVGRYTDQKAQHHLIEIARRLKPTVPELRIAVVGWGPREATLRERAKAADVDGVIRFTGRRDDVPQLLQAADLYVSVSDWEGMPLSMIEAMTAGLPVVTTAVEGIGPLVDAHNGLSCPPGDVDALTDAVRAIAVDEVRRQRLGEASRARALTSHSLEAMGAKVADVLREVAR